MFGSILVAGACHDNDDDDVVMVWTEWLVRVVAHFCCAILWRRRMMTLAQGVFLFLWMRERSVCPFVHAEK
jgi:hypothetical protein